MITEVHLEQQMTPQGELLNAYLIRSMVGSRSSTFQQGDTSVVVAVGGVMDGDTVDRMALVPAYLIRVNVPSSYKAK